MKTIGSREFQLLCACARSRLNEEHKQKIRELAGEEIDWEVLVEISARHKTLPLVYKSLKEASPKEVPEPILHKLRAIFIQNGVRCLQMTEELVQVINQFEGAGIAVVPLKGPLLAETLFGDPAFRSYCDLDLLIPTAKMPAAIKLLVSYGYSPDIDLDDDQFLSLARAGNHAALVKPGNGLTIELHWELTGRLFRKSIEFAEVEPRLRQTFFSGRVVNNLGGEDLLVFLCIHGTKHYWGQLDMVCCVAELIRAEASLDWMLTLDLADRLGARKMLFMGLILARELLDAKLPDQMTLLLKRQKNLAAFTAGIINSLALTGTDTVSNNSCRQYLLFHFLSMDRLSGFIRYALVRPLFNTTHSDWQQMKLPAGLAFLHYFIRPFRLMWKYLGPAGKGDSSAVSDQEI